MAGITFNDVKLILNISEARSGKYFSKNLNDFLTKFNILETKKRSIPWFDDDGDYHPDYDNNIAELENEYYNAYFVPLTQNMEYIEKEITDIIMLTYLTIKNNEIPDEISHLRHYSKMNMMRSYMLITLQKISGFTFDEILERIEISNQSSAYDYDYRDDDY
ncbi:hypothetical protein ABHN09_16245 [Bacillus paramobilis]|uniref:hypothetical protein n=1 Tax=Bacillus paramobilis TaxID=2817477 RepID=UPI003D1DEDA2